MVLDALVQELKSSGNSLEHTSSDNLPQETLSKIIEFFFNDKISRASQNTKDFLTIVEGKEKKMTVKHLLYPLKECFVKIMLNWLIKKQMKHETTLSNLKISLKNQKNQGYQEAALL